MNERLSETRLFAARPNTDLMVEVYRKAAAPLAQRVIAGIVTFQEMNAAVPSDRDGEGLAKMPHLEFVVPGPPVSYQTSDRANLKVWQAAIKAAAARVWTIAPLPGKVKFLLINFHEGDKPPLDDDNMIKPIRDALNKLVYDDDRQIRHSETLQVSIDAPIKIRRASKILLDAFCKGDEFIYVRIEDAPEVIQLPQ